MSEIVINEKNFETEPSAPHNIAVDRPYLCGICLYDLLSHRGSAGAQRQHGGRM